LGSSWLIVLRCVSALDALKVRDNAVDARADYVTLVAVLLTAQLLTALLSTAVHAGLSVQARCESLLATILVLCLQPFGNRFYACHLCSTS
jgi:hypothetical protein